MNKIHSKVWNKELGQLVVASEFAKSDSAGAVQGAGGASLRRTLLAVVSASLVALMGAGGSAFAQEWTASDGSTTTTVGDGDTVTFQGDSNIHVTLDDSNATFQVALDPNLVVDSVTAGNTVMNNSGVAVGASVMLGSSGLTLSNGISVTLAGINAGNNVITGVANGTAADQAVNFGQLNAVDTTASDAQSAASAAQTTADNAQAAAATAQATAEAAGAGWTVTDGTHAANIGPGGEVAFSGDANITVTQSGSEDAGAIGIALNPDLEVTSVTTGNTTIDSDGLAISGGPSVTSAGIDAGGSKITNVAAGDINASSSDAVTGGQIYDLFIEEGAGGVRYFHANSTQPDSEAVGDQSVAIGPNTVAAGDSSFAAGDGAATTATAAGAIALGQGAAAGTEGGAVTDGDGSIAIGRDSQASGNSTLAMGDGASVEDERVSNSMAMGSEARVSGMGSSGALAAGYQAHAGAANATAVGAGAYAGGGSATALGASANATGGSSIAIGQASATAGSAVAAGSGAYAGTTRGIALGSGAGVGTEGNEAGDRTDHIAIGTNSGQDVVGNKSTAIGYGAGQGVTGDDNLAIGTEAGRGLEGNNNISIGRNANDGAGNKAQAVAIGDKTQAGSDSVALGSGAIANGSETLALGKDASAGSNGVAVGAHTTAEGSNIAIGRNSSAWQSDVTGAGYLTGTAAPGNAVSVGSSAAGEAFQRRIINVADGAQRYDAVNVGQLEVAQQAVANLVGGNVTVEPNGTFGGYVIELQDTDGNSHQYGTVAEAINAVSSGDISVLPGNAVIYNPDGTITVAAGQAGDQAVNVDQLNAAIDENGIKYFSANTTEAANRNNDGATGANAMAIGPSAVASGNSSLAIGDAARVNAGADNGVAIGHDVSARAANTTVLGNRSHAYDQGGVAIGQEAVSQGRNSIVMGTGAEADPKSGGSVDNAIVIGTDAEATADDGIAVGQSALASEERAVAQGYDAHAMATDSQAFGTRARSTGVNAQASGTDANASGVSAIATGTRANASGTNAIANGTDSLGYASDGIAIGTGAVSGVASPLPEEAYRNVNGIAVGNSALADNHNALALGVEAQARAGSSTAIGDSAEATGERSSAMGYQASTQGTDSLAIGSFAVASGPRAGAIGVSATSSGNASYAMGYMANAESDNGIAIGTTSHVSGQSALAIGMNSNATGGSSLSAGVDSEASGASSAAIGRFANASGTSSLAVGYGSQASAVDSTAVGSGNIASGRQSVAIGSNNNAAANSSIAMGNGASTASGATNAIALGAGATAAQQGAVALGSGAVTATAVGTASITVDGNTYGFAGISPVATVSVGTPGAERTITNVAAGRINATSTDAINGSQLHGTNMALEALAGNLDTAGQSVASALGGGSSYNPATHQVTANLSVGGNTYNNVQDALTYVGQGWDVSAEGGASANVAPGGSVDFSSSDGNIEIARSGTDLAFELADDIEIGNSVTVGDTYIDGDSIVTNNLTVEGETRLGDNFVVNNNGDVTYNGAEIATQDDGLSFAGNTGGTISKTLGDNTPLTISGGLAASEASTGANLRVDSDGNQLNLVMARDLTDLDSITINNGGPVINGSGIDMGGNQITGLADGTADSDAVNLGQLKEVSEAANAGWNVSVDGEGAVAGNNVGPDGVVDFSNDDGNIEIDRTGTDLAFNLADDLEIGNSITVGDTVIDGTGVSVGDDVHLGDTGLVINGGPSVTAGGIDAGGTVITNVGPGVNGTDAVNMDQLTELAGTPLTFAGDAGTNVDRMLGETVNLVGGATDATALTDGNIGVVADGTDTLAIKLNKDIDLGADGSLAIGDTQVDTAGVAVTDAAGNTTTVGADGTTVDDGAGNTTTIGAGTVAVTDGTQTTTIGGTEVSVGGANPILISGDTGTIGGLTNTTFDPDNYTSGQAATEDQLKQVSDVANAGWNLTGSGADEVNIGPNGAVDFQGDTNIIVAQTGVDQDGVIEVTLNRDLDVDSVTAGDTVLDTDGLAVTDAAGNTTTVGADGTTVDDGAGNTTTIGAGTVAVTDGVETTTIGATEVSVGGANPIVISGDTGTIGGLQNQTIDYPEFADGSGRAATEEQLDLVNQTANAGWNLTGSGADEVNIGPNGAVDFQGDTNITVAQTGVDQDGVIEVTLNRDLDVDSVTAGDTVLDTDGLAVTDAAGNTTTVGADGTTVDDGAGNTTTIGAGTVAVTDGAGTTTIGGTEVSVGGANPIVISGDTGTIGGLTNTTFDPNNYTSGQAATEDQLGQVYDVANAGWNVSAEGANATNVGVNSDTGNSVDLNNADGNIVISKTADSNDVTFDLAENIDLGADGSLTTGNTVVDTDGVVVTDAAGNTTTVAADGTTVEDVDGNSTAIGAGTVAVTDGTGTTTIGGNVVSVGGANPIVISGDTGTIGGLQNQTIDYPEFADGSGRAATEEQLDQVNQTANAGWNLTGSGADEVNIGPNGSVDFQGDGNITVAQTGVDQDGVIEVTLNRDLDLDSVTIGDTFIDTTGVAIGTDVHLGGTGLVINGGPSVTTAGIDAGGLVITNVAPGEISATSQDAVNGSQLHGMGDSITSIIGGNAVLNPDGTITTSDIGGTGYDNIDDAIRSANDAANAGWTATDAAGNDANIGPNGTVTFVGDDNVTVSQTGTDGDAVVEVTLNRDLDVDSITAGDTVIDTDGVSVGDDVHLGDTGLVIDGGPSVTTDGIDAGGDVISNVAAGVEDTDAVNVGQLNELAGTVNDNDERVTNLENGAAGPFQVSQDSNFVPPAPTGGNSAAGGDGAVASGDNSTALGNQSVASGHNSTAIGQGAQATHDNSVALGQGSATTVGAQAGYDAAYVGSSDSAGEVNVGNRTISGVAPGSAGTDAVNVNQLNAGVTQAVVTANDYTDQRFNQIQGDVWNLHGRVDELEKSINSGVASAMAMRQAPYVAGATTYYAGFGAYKGEGALGVSLRRTSDNGRWSLEGGFSANRDGTGGYIGVSGVLGGN